MPNYLEQAFANVDRSFAAASKAMGSVPRSLTNGMPSIAPFSASLSKAGEQYAHFSGWVYVAVKTVASKLAGQPIQVARLAKASRTGRKVQLPTFAKSLDELVEPIANHPFLEAMQSPNPLQTQWALIYSTVCSMLLSGRSCWWVTDADGTLQIWPLPSTWVEPADRLRTGWKIRPPGMGEAFDVPAEDIIPFILPDPSNPFGMGVSPLQSQAKAVATDEAIQTSQHAAFQNGIFPTMAVRVGTLPGMQPGQPGDQIILEPEQRIELVQMISQLYRGAVRSGEPMILDGLITDVSKISNTPAEMDFLNSGEQVRKRIFQAFGISPIIAGEIQDVNRASAASASALFAEHTCNPLVELLSQTLTRFACQRFASSQEKLLAWVEPVKANDAEQRLSEWKVALAAGVVTPNEYRTAILNLQEIAGGDVVRDALGNPRE